jgi:hypothetical protein
MQLDEIINHHNTKFKFKIKIDMCNKLHLTGFAYTTLCTNRKIDTYLIIAIPCCQPTYPS